mmetsp:Transcript_22320/g.56874  ORF Transcript_22320/g.56874 Transcript_22320/m.56874 type:complete len:92 (+) Transcript_22320:798-1073(+)
MLVTMVEVAGKEEKVPVGAIDWMMVPSGCMMYCAGADVMYDFAGMECTGARGCIENMGAGANCACTDIGREGRRRLRRPRTESRSRTMPMA